MSRHSAIPGVTITVAVASRDRVWVDSLAVSLGRHGLRVQPLRSECGQPRGTLEGVDVLVLDTDSLTAADLDLAARLQRSHPLVEVVAIAGDTPVADAVKALRAGVFTVLQHPVAEGLLVEALTAAGRRHRHARARLEELDGGGSPPLGDRRVGPPGATVTRRKNRA